MVPLLYEMEACHNANYRFYDDWQALSPDQKEQLVALYTIQRLKAAHEEDAKNDFLKKKRGNT